jgi:uncharacterized protein (TIGR02147 family)
MPTQVQVFRYLDPVTFLRDWIDARRAGRSSFTTKAWLAKHRGAGISAAAFSNILARRRAPQIETAQALVGPLELDEEEGAFFVLLVSLGRVTNLSARMDILEKVYSHPRFRGARHIDADELTYLSTWLGPALRELSLLPGWSPDPAWIERRLRAAVAKEEIEQALVLLRRLGMLDADLQPVRAEIHVATGVDAHHAVAARYHEGVLSLAASSLERVPWDERFYTGLTLAVPESLLPKLRRELFHLLEHVSTLCDSDPGERKNVHQISIQFFPLTQEPEPPR